MSRETITTNIKLQNVNESMLLFGANDSNLKLLETEYDVSIISRGESIVIAGLEEPIDKVHLILKQLLQVIRKGIHISARDVAYAIQLEKKGTIEYFIDIYNEEIAKNTKGKAIRAKTVGQRQYVSAINKHDLVFGIGPAGTGKTYLAVVMAVTALKQNQIKKIILTRPAVEAGESLGFLPGDLKEKVDPYLRPLYDSLYDVLGSEQTQRLIDREVIEVAPLAYMRGRTLEDAFVILDEAQNTTFAQMKMFLTRLGFNSKMVITGDKTQVDLPRGSQSGLVSASNILGNVKGISFVHLEQTDVVRHPIVSKIIQAYDESDAKA